MNQEKKTELFQALKQSQVEDNPEDAKLVEGVILDEIATIEPILDRWITEARDYYLRWAIHLATCPGEAFNCDCGLNVAILGRTDTR